MPLTYEPTRWADLRTGATILCPKDGQPERVTFSRTGGLGRRHVRTERHDHIRAAGDKVPAHNDNGHRDVTYRTRYGTAIATRPGPRAPWWLHLPTGWGDQPEADRPTTRRNGNGAFFFRSQAAVARWLAPYLEAEPAGAPDQQDRRQPDTDPLRRGGYT